MRTKTNPVFYADQLRMLLPDQPERVDRVLTDPEDPDFLTWNVFASLDTHRDRDYLAYRLQALGGSEVRAPVRMSLWTGRDRGPRLLPSHGYVTMVRERARRAGGTATATTELEAPIEVPVRIESSDVLVLVETVGDEYPRGPGGRDRIVELVDAGLEHARRLSVNLAVAVVYWSGTRIGSELSARMNALRDPAGLAAAMPYRDTVPPVVLREVPWQQLLRMWEQESHYLRIPGGSRRAFADLVRHRHLT